MAVPKYHPMAVQLVYKNSKGINRTRTATAYTHLAASHMAQCCALAESLVNRERSARRGFDGV